MLDSPISEQGSLSAAGEAHDALKYCMASKGYVLDFCYAWLTCAKDT